MAAPGPPPSPEFLAESKADQVVAIIIVFPTIALIIVGLRIWTKFGIVRGASWDDYCIAGALVSIISLWPLNIFLTVFPGVQHRNVDMSRFP